MPLDRQEANSDTCEQVLDMTETIYNSSNGTCMGGLNRTKSFMTLMCASFEQGKTICHTSLTCVQVLNKAETICYTCVQVLNRAETICHTCVLVLNRSKTICDTCVQVCEVYKLHKETYYLAVNFIDRFLLATEKIKTSKLQLVGVTALFMASKIEVGKMIVWC